MHNYNQFSYISTKTYIVGSQKNCLHAIVLLGTQNILIKLKDKKYSQFYAQNFVGCNKHVSITISTKKYKVTYLVIMLKLFKNLK